MDKLKPIIAQKFWIMFFVVLIMPLAGYFMTKGELSAKITERLDKLNKTFSGIPTGTGVPNDSWATKLNETTSAQKVHNTRANQELWLKQKERMVWPKDVAPYMANAEYFKELNQAQKGDQVLFKYPRGYEAQIRALWEIVDPLEDGVNLRDSNKRKKIAFPMADLHQAQRMYLGDNVERTFAEIWGAQEDIWLQTELLHAIRRMNENAISQGDASIKQLGKVLLFGGTKASGDAPTSSAAATGGAGTEMPQGMMPFGGGGQRPDGAASVSTDINYAEEFDASKEAGGTGGNVMKDLASGGFPGGAGATDPNAGGAGGAKSEVKRYIDFDEKQAYKRRGFYIKLVMNHRKVPDLLAELMNSPFPVEIVRVQQVWYSDGGASTGGGGAGSMAGGGATGLPGFNKQPSRGDGTDAFTSPTPSGFDADSGGGGAGRSGANNPGSAAALADPNLAHVAILGVWTLYLPPPPVADAGQAPPVTSPVPAAGVAVTPEKTAPPADVGAETSDKPATTEPMDTTADEAKKPDDSDTPKSEPAKPEKSESDSDKPAAQKAPSKTEADDKSGSESK